MGTKAIWLLFEEDDPFCGNGNFIGSFSSHQKLMQYLDLKGEQFVEEDDAGIHWVWRDKRWRTETNFFRSVLNEQLKI